MVELEGARRLLLRVEFQWGVVLHVAHTVQISEREVFVWTDAPVRRKDALDLALSFPGLLEPLTLRGTVAQRFASVDPGDPVGLVLTWDQRGPDAEALRLFLGRVDEALQGSRRRPRGDAEPYRVLFVEDSDLMRDMFHLGALKYFRRDKKGMVEVDIASNLAGAWELYRHSRYDMVLVDFYLPDGTGNELVTRIRNRPADTPTTCVGVSVGGTEARQRLLGAGVDMFLDKPVVLQDLFSTLEVLSAVSQ